ncbi:uncharacterized protein YjbI with pentapeptide repeats [Rhizobium aquaticum]|uniref:Uncharacterized protein YjbI with pentapeptide repeats n=1 Tax=Rhizobium aquaticum TaxID=1549636 RepID=A0ABV2IXU4_9HYPH
MQTDQNVGSNQSRTSFQKAKKIVTQASHACNVIASFGVIFAVIFFITGQKDRETQEEASAWAALSNPKPGISVARQLEYLSKDGWFRSASKFENVHLTPEVGAKGISLAGLKISNTSFESAKIENSTISNAEIKNSELNLVSFKNSDIIDSKIEKIQIINSDFRNSRIIKSNITGIYTGANFDKIISLDSRFELSIPRVSIYNREKIDFDRFDNVSFENSLIRDSQFFIPEPEEMDECGTFNFRSLELYYSKIEVAEDKNLNRQMCRFYMDNSWIIGSEIKGNAGVRCSGCTIAFSKIEIESSLLVEQDSPLYGSIALHLSAPSVKNSTIYQTKIIGKSPELNFENAKLKKVDISQLNLHGSNVSGAEFDLYDFSENSGSPKSDKPDSFRMIFLKGDGRYRGLKDMDIHSFDSGLAAPETPEQVRARYPAEGLKSAWAWRDRPPKGLPTNVPGPILCDEKLRKEKPESEFDLGKIPDECKPSDWQDVFGDSTISLSPETDE